MTSTSERPDQEPRGDDGNPGDVPAGRPASLDRLDLLTGQWPPVAAPAPTWRAGEAAHRRRFSRWPPKRGPKVYTSRPVDIKPLAERIRAAAVSLRIPRHPRS